MSILTLKIRRCLLLCILISTVQVAFANTALWIAVPGISATTNWSDLANWSNLGTGSAGPFQNDVKFGAPGAATSAGVITSVVDITQHPLSLTYTNTNGQFHTTYIATGAFLTNDNALTVGGLTADALTTVAAIAGPGAFIQNGTPVTVQEYGNTVSTALATLDLSGLTTFVYTNTNGLINVGGTGGNRSAGTLNLAAASNYLTVSNLNLGTGSGANAATSALKLGPGTNIINVANFSIVNNKNSATLSFQAPGAGLRLRGLGGNDTNRANFTIANRNQTGTGTAAGTLSFNGSTVDIKAATMIIGENTAGSSVDTGTGIINFDTGTIDATTIIMGYCSNVNASAVANGTITVGSGATLLIGSGGLSMVNRTTSGGASSGTLNINGGAVIASTNIFKTNTGTATIAMNGGTLTMLAGAIGSAAAPIDAITLTSATLQAPVVSGVAAISVTTLSLNDAASVINVTALPFVTAYPSQFPLVTYGSLPTGNAFNLGTLPSTYKGYLSDNGSGTISLFVTNGPSAVKADEWGGSVNNLWDTTSLNWTNNGVAVAYGPGDTVTFDDSGRTGNISVAAPQTPSAVTVSNNTLNYIFSGAGSIVGPVSLIKYGTASLTLSESGGDAFSSGITVNGGAVILDDTNSAIGGGLIIASGAAVQIGNNDGNGALPSGLLQNDGTLIFNLTNNIVVSTAIPGNGSLTQNGSGTLTLSGVETYLGNTTVSKGVLALTGSTSLSNSAQLAVTNATLDLTGATGPSTLPTAIFVNATLALTMPNSTTPVNVPSLTGGGTANTINVAALPPIASYPSSLTLVQAGGTISGFNFVLGTLPAGSPSYAGTLAQSADHTAIVLTVTAGPVGVRPYVAWSGADVPNLNTNWSDRLNWELPGAPAPSDTVVFNNTDTEVASAVTTMGGGWSAFTSANVNNIVDTNFSIATLIYTNTGGSCHNTEIAPGQTLAITNTLTIGGFDSGSSAQTALVSISGTNAALSVNNTNASVQVWIGSGSVGGSQAILDLSALDNFNARISKLAVGACAVNNAVNRPSGVLYLARTNVITAEFQTTTIESAGTTTGNAAIVVADCNQNAGNTSYLYLGQNNTITADTIAIGRQKAGAHFQFNPTFANVAPYPTASFLGYSSNVVSVFNVGDGVGNTGTTSFTADADFTGGTVVLAAATMNIGRAPNSTTGTGTIQGSLEFDAGTITVNDLNIGLQPTNGTKVGTGSVSVNTNTTIGAAATLVVTGNLTLGTSGGGTGAASTSGTLTINGGTVQANNIVVDANGGASTVTLNSGVLVITNSAGAPATPITTLNLNGGTLQLNPGGNSGVPGVVATTISSGGTTIVSIGSFANLTTPPVIPLLGYTGTDPYASLVLGAVPAGYVCALIDDTANSTIDLSITPTFKPSPRIISFVVTGTTLNLQGVNGASAGRFVLLGTTNLATPLPQWTRLATNNFGVDGTFNLSTSLGTPTPPQQFFLLAQ